jgi:hypothetical protein
VFPDKTRHKYYYTTRAHNSTIPIPSCPSFVFDSWPGVDPYSRIGKINQSVISPTLLPPSHTVHQAVDQRFPFSFGSHQPFSPFLSTFQYAASVCSSIIGSAVASVASVANVSSATWTWLAPICFSTGRSDASSGSLNLKSRTEAFVVASVTAPSWPHYSYWRQKLRVCRVVSRWIPSQGQIDQDRWRDVGVVLRHQSARVRRGVAEDAEG